MWEKTSYELEKIQSNIITAEEEFSSLENRVGPIYSCNFELKNVTVLSGMLFYFPILYNFILLLPFLYKC